MFVLECLCGARFEAAAEPQVAKLATAHLQTVHDTLASSEKVARAIRWLPIDAKVGEHEHEPEPEPRDASRLVREILTATAALVADRANDRTVAGAAKLLHRTLQDSQNPPRVGDREPMAAELLRYAKQATPQHVARWRRRNRGGAGQPEPTPPTSDVTDARISAPRDASASRGADQELEPVEVMDPKVTAHERALARLQEKALADEARRDELEAANERVQRQTMLSQIMAAQHQANMSVIRNIRA